MKSYVETRVRRRTKRVKENFEEFAHDRGVVESLNASSRRLGVLKDDAGESQVLASHRVVVDVKIFHCPSLLDLNTRENLYTTCVL